MTNEPSRVLHLARTLNRWWAMRDDDRKVHALPFTSEISNDEIAELVRKVDPGLYVVIHEV